MTNIVHTVHVEGRSVGIDKLANELEGVAVAADKTERATESTSRAFAAMERSVNPAALAAYRLEKAQRLANAELAKGAITAERHAEVMQMAVQRYQAVETAANMHTRAMAASSNTSKMAAMQQRNLVFQLNDVAVSLASGMNPLMVAAQQGSQIATIYGPGEGGIGRAFRETGKMALGAAQGLGRFAAAHPAAIAGTIALGLGLRGIVNDLHAAGNASVGYGDVAIATFQVIGGGLYRFVEPAYTAVAATIGSAMDWSAEKVKWFGNTSIGVFVGAKDGISAAWEMIPSAIGSAVYTGANAVITGVEYMVNGAIGIVNGFVASVEGVMNLLPDFAKPGGGLSLGRIDSVNIGKVENPFAGAGTAAGQAFSTAFGAAMSVDYLGDFADAVKAKAIANSLKEVEGAAKSAGGAMKKAAEDAKDPWEGLRETTEKTKGVFEGLGTDITTGFRQMFEDGKISAKEFGDYIADVFLNIGDRLIENALKPMEKALNDFFANTSASNGGNWLSMLFGIGGGLFPAAPGGIQDFDVSGLFAKGGVFDKGGVTAFAKGGIVNRPTLFPFAKGTGLMGEAGPEAIMPLKRAANGSLGVAMHGGGAGAVNVTYAPAVTINGGDDKAVAEMKAMLAQHRREIPRIAVEAVQNARGRGAKV